MVHADEGNDITPSWPQSQLRRWGCKYFRVDNIVPLGGTGLQHLHLLFNCLYWSSVPYVSVW